MTESAPIEPLVAEELAGPRFRPRSGPAAVSWGTDRDRGRRRIARRCEYTRELPREKVVIPGSGVGRERAGSARSRAYRTDRDLGSASPPCPGIVGGPTGGAKCMQRCHGLVAQDVAGNLDLG